MILTHAARVALLGGILGIACVKADELTDARNTKGEPGGGDKLLSGKKAKKFFGTLGASHELSRVIVRLKQWRNGKGYEHFDILCEVERTDAKTLAGVTYGIEKSKWGRVTPESSGAMGAYPEGEVILESKQGKCRIFLQGAFYLDTGNGCEYEDLFESWTLAKIINELLKEKRGKGLPEKEFKLLSGEKDLELEKAQFEKLWSEE